MSPKNTPMTDLSPDNKIINGLWISPDGRPLSNLERLCIYSFCAHGHDFRLWTYGDLPNVPQDTAPGKVEVRDGNEILPADKIFTYYNSLAGFADWFRWELLRRFGGWWVDMDMICLRPFNFIDEIVFGEEAIDSFHVGALKFPAAHSLPEGMAKSCAHPLQAMPWDDEKCIRRKRRRRVMFWQNPHEKQGWGELGGPSGFTRAVNHFGLASFAESFFAFNAVHWSLTNRLTDNTLHKFGILMPLLESCHAFHFANAIWQQHALDKNGAFHSQSPFEILKRRYLPEFKES